MRTYIITEDQARKLMTEDEEKKYPTLTREQEAGIKLTALHLKKKFPYVMGVRVDKREKPYETYLRVDIDIDLNKFLDITGTKLKKYFLHNNEDLDGYEIMYLIVVLDPNTDRDAYGYTLNNDMVEEMDKFYGRLPQYMQVTVYQDTTDDGLPNDFARRWKEDKEPMGFHTGHYKLHFDPKKYTPTK